MEIATKFGIYALECLFGFGIIGSAIVVLLSSIEDSEVFFGGDSGPADMHPQAASAQQEKA